MFSSLFTSCPRRDPDKTLPCAAGRLWRSTCQSRCACASEVESGGEQEVRVSQALWWVCCARTRTLSADLAGPQLSIYTGSRARTPQGGCYAAQSPDGPAGRHVGRSHGAFARLAPRSSSAAGRASFSLRAMAHSRLLNRPPAPSASVPTRMSASRRAGAYWRRGLRRLAPSAPSSNAARAPPISSGDAPAPGQ